MTGHPPPQVGTLITVYMQDFRFDPSRNNPEHLLAELVVPLMTESVSEGTVFWVSAVSLVQALQAGPGRIDGTVFFHCFIFTLKLIVGAAKISAKRGKYRQCFVRLLEGGVTEGLSPDSMLKLSAEKSIELVVETVCPSQTFVIIFFIRTRRYFHISRSILPRIPHNHLIPEP